MTHQPIQTTPRANLWQHRRAARRAAISIVLAAIAISATPDILAAQSVGPTLTSAPAAADAPKAKSQAPGASATADPSPPPTSPVASPPEPKWLQPPAEELAYRRKVRALIAPLLANPPSADEVAALKDALKTRSPAALGDSAARKLVQWQALKAGLGEPEAFVDFIAANPAWPDSAWLMRRAEEQLFAKGGNSTEIKAFFKGREPQSGAGWAALASAYNAEGNAEKAREAAAHAWTDEDLSTSFETGFIERFAALLQPADHRRRLDRLLIDRVRFKADRRERAAIARRVIALLPEPDRKAALARLAVFLKAPNAGQLLAALPADTDPPSDWGLAYARATHHLDQHRLEAAAQILTRLPDDADKLVSPDDWWLARREAAFDALTAGRNGLAYDLVKTAGPLSVNPLKEQAHMAGWVALRLQKKPSVALEHFNVALKAADGPLSRARAAYWSGRTLEALGRKDEAKARYATAMRDPDTFHGLLSRQKIAGGPRTKLAITPPALASEDVAQRFIKHDAVRAAVLAKQAGLDRNILIGLFAGLRNHLETEAELALLAELAASLRDPQTSLRVGKTAIARGHNLLMYAYPIDPYPVYEPLRTPPETAMLLAITRQETEFNSAIVSSAGARGLMQVMPITARHVCQQHKIKCDVPRLLTDQAYNARFGSAYIGDRMVEFGGWYAVTLAGYNAGPGRARQWMRQNGDPRTDAIDTIDWIERIPIEETRHYVEKVLSNIQVYRARLGDPEALRLELDLTTATGLKRSD